MYIAIHASILGIVTPAVTMKVQKVQFYQTSTIQAFWTDLFFGLKKLSQTLKNIAQTKSYGLERHLAATMQDHQNYPTLT